MATKNSFGKNNYIKLLFIVLGVTLLVLFGIRHRAEEKTSLEIDKSRILKQEIKEKLHLGNDAVKKPDDPTASWKTYTNQKYGYTVKYPSNLQAHEVNTSYDHYVEFTLGRDAAGNAYLPAFTLTAASENFGGKDGALYNYLTPEWVTNFYTMKTGETKSDGQILFKKLPDMQVAGQPAAMIEVTATGSNQKRAYLKKNGYVFMLSGFNDASAQPDDFNNFLSSFTFTN